MSHYRVIRVVHSFRKAIQLLDQRQERAVGFSTSVRVESMATAIELNASRIQ
jgi:hypothetical protein